MACLIGYMLTWPTYGSWLQGDEKGYAKDGVQYGKDPRLLRANKKLLQKPAVTLSGKHKQLICDEIHKTANSMGQSGWGYRSILFLDQIPIGSIFLIRANLVRHCCIARL